MYAIIRTGGKQAKVREGDVLSVELIKDTETVAYTPLLIVSSDGSVISDPAALKKASVTAEVIGESAGPKIDIFKYKNKTGYRRRQGHRQKYTTIRVTGIKVPATKAKSSKAKATESTAAETPSAKKKAPKPEKAASGAPDKEA